MKATAISSNVAPLRESAALELNTAPVDFTPRQREVLLLLGEGLPTKLICRRLNIAIGTVKVHICFILRKLGVSSRLQAVVAAHRGGLLGGFGANTSEPATGSTSVYSPAPAAGAPSYNRSRRLSIAA